MPRDQKETFFKIFYINGIVLLSLAVFFLTLLEIYLRKAKPFSLFPKELTGKRELYFKNKTPLIVTDAKKGVSFYEPKTEVNYIHNMNGFRSDKNIDDYDLGNSVITIGDSTSYGLNINNEKTYTSLLKESKNIENSINLSYPGLNLNSLVYRLGCLNEVLNKNNIQNNTTIISLYYNDIEGLNALPFATEKCNSLKEINLLNANLVNEYENDLVIDNNFRKFKIFTKLKNFEKYPYYLDRLICKKLYEQSCKLIKFSLGNLSPKVKSYIFGNHQTTGLYEDMKKGDKEKLIFLEKNLYLNLVENSKLSKNTILFYIPRHENDLTSQIKNKKRERIFYLYKNICNKIESKNKQIFCIDGSQIILKSLNNIQITKLIKGGRLPEKYYSYLKMYDLGHPSEYVSKIYQKRIIELIEDKK